MKNEGALRMRFKRHVGIYRSDVSSLQVNPGRGSAFRSDPGQAIGRAGKNTPFSSSAMSSGRLFLDRVAHATGRTIRDVAREKSGIPEERLNSLLNPQSQVG